MLIREYIRQVLTEMEGEQISMPGTEPRYLVGMTYDTWTPEDIEHGDTDDKGWHREYEEMDLYDLQRLAEEHSWEGSSSHPHPGMWWSSHGEDADIRTGARTNYGLHVKRLDGQALDQEETEYIDKIVKGEIKAEDEMESMGHDSFGYGSYSYKNV